MAQSNKSNTGVTTTHVYIIIALLVVIAGILLLAVSRGSLQLTSEAQSSEQSVQVAPRKFH